VKTKGVNRKNKNSLREPNSDSEIRPVPHSEELPAPVFEGLLQVDSLLRDEELVSTDSDSTLADNDLLHCFLSPQLFSQGKLNGLVRDLNLLKSRLSCLLEVLKKKSSTTKNNTLIAFYRKHHGEFMPCIILEKVIANCNNSEDLLKNLGVTEMIRKIGNFLLIV